MPIAHAPTIGTILSCFGLSCFSVVQQETQVSPETPVWRHCHSSSQCSVYSLPTHPPPNPRHPTLIYLQCIRTPGPRAPARQMVVRLILCPCLEGVGTREPAKPWGESCGCNSGRHAECGAGHFLVDGDFFWLKGGALSAVRAQCACCARSATIWPSGRTRDAYFEILGAPRGIMVTPSGGYARRSTFGSRHGKA